MPKVEFYDDIEGGRWGFDCPGCKMGHELPVQPMPHDSTKKGWGFNFDVEKPTFEPSILTRYGYKDGGAHEICHSFVRDGMIQFLGDCTHALAGQTVPLQEVDNG
jgi:hypothetical protein